METLLFILKIVPTLIDTIVAIEKQIPGSGNGSAKLDAIKNILMAIDSSYSKYWATLVGVITTLVNLFNKTGAFTTTQKPVLQGNAGDTNAMAQTMSAASIIK